MLGLGFYGHNNYNKMLNNFLDIVENDTSSILFYTRVFDESIFNGILNIFSNNNFEVLQQNNLNIESNFFFIYFNFFNFYLNSYFDIFLNFYGLSESFFDLFNNILFNNMFLYFFFNFSLYSLNIEFIEFFLNNYVLYFQKNELFKVIILSVDIFSDFLFYIDIFLVVLELLLVLFIFLLLFSKISNFFIITKFYDNILNFFKYNNISFLEVSITCTLFLSFYIFDIFLSFSEDDFSDTFFYLILIFILLMFFFLCIAIDVQYFYSMSNVSNGDISIRLLFFDILNNFLGILRIFLCWTRYIFYDIQVETIDFSFHYIDYNNEIYINSLLKDDFFNILSFKNTNLSFIIFFKSFLFYILFFFSDILIIITQIILSVFKLLIAFYLLWLIVDLFILKVLNLKESLKLKK